MDEFISAVNRYFTEQRFCAGQYVRKWKYSSEQNKVLTPWSKHLLGGSRKYNYLIHMSNGYKCNENTS